MKSSQNLEKKQSILRYYKPNVHQTWENDPEIFSRIQETIPEDIPKLRTLNSLAVADFFLKTNHFLKEFRKEYFSFHTEELSSIIKTFYEYMKGISNKYHMVLDDVSLEDVEYLVETGERYLQCQLYEYLMESVKRNMVFDEDIFYNKILQLSNLVKPSHFGIQEILEVSNEDLLYSAVYDILDCNWMKCIKKTMECFRCCIKKLSCITNSFKETLLLLIFILIKVKPLSLQSIVVISMLFTPSESGSLVTQEQRFLCSTIYILKKIPMSQNRLGPELVMELAERWCLDSRRKKWIDKICGEGMCLEWRKPVGVGRNPADSQPGDNPRVLVAPVPNPNLQGHSDADR